MEESRIKRKPRILCLHGFRSSAEILKKQVSVWPETLLERLDLDFLDAPFPAEGKSGHEDEGVFDPPYFEWFQANEDYSEYRNFEECIAYIEHYTIKHGPFDGFLGFSQGAFLTTAFPGMQLHGVTLTKVPRIKFMIVISGGEKDIARPEAMALLESFLDPVVIHHPEGHHAPKLDEKNQEIMLGFIERIEKMSST